MAPVAEEPANLQRVDEVSRHLTDLGLEETEVKVYLALLRNGPSKAGSVISLTDASRGTVYRVLGELVDRGIVAKQLSSPARYHAVEPRDLFEASIESLNRQKQYVEILQERLEEPLKRLARADQERTEPEWAILQGRSSIYDRMDEICKKAEQQILHLTTQDLHIGSIPLVEQAWKTLQERGERGLDVRVLSHRPDEIGDRLTELGSTGNIAVRGLDVDELLHFVIADGQEVVYWLDASDLPGVHEDDDVAMHTDAPGLVQGAKMLFRDHWS